MHIVRDISWSGYADWTVGTIGDYMAIFTNISTLDTLLNQMFWENTGLLQVVDSLQIIATGPHPVIGFVLNHLHQAPRIHSLV